MDKTCDACEFLKEPKHQILTTKYWNAGLGNDQAYFGRAYVTLKQHKPSLSSLSDEEWRDFASVARQLEKAYKEAYGAEPLNWGCYMNHAFRKEPFNPHVHWHIYPRYSNPPTLEGEVYDDSLFGEFYDHTKEKFVSDVIVEKIADRLRLHLGN